MEKPQKFYQNLRTFILLLILIVISGNVGYRLGNKSLQSKTPFVKKTVINTEVPNSKDVDFVLFWDVWNRLEQKYLEKDKIDAQKMVYGAISGMVASLGDPYTVFLPPKENTDFKADLSGAFEGIGAQLGIKEEKIVVIAPLKNHPAEKAGILAGDWIARVNDEDTIGWTVPEAVNKIRGPKNTQVKLTIYRENKPEAMEIKVTRDKIILKSVELELKNIVENCSANCEKVGLITLSRFGDQTNDEWNEVVVKLKSELNNANIKGIILDLRNNPGGYFQSSINIASEFIKSGVVVIQENSDGTRETYSVTKIGNLLNPKMAVLINKGSASAAEIVAGALRDHKRAVLIGEKTFGKGSIQTPEDLPDGSGVHITTARWILPNGEWINSKGIAPDMEVNTPETTASADIQLNKALEYFK